MRWEKSGVGRFATARYSTVDAAFPRMRRPLAYKSTPRALRMRESHRLNGTLTRLTNECWRTKIFRLRWDKSGVVGLASWLMFVVSPPCAEA